MDMDSAQLMPLLRAMLRAPATTAVALLCLGVALLPRDSQARLLAYRGGPSAPLPAFWHANPVHLLFNVYWFVLLGLQMEPALGNAGMLAFVFATAAASNAAQFWAAGPNFLGLSGVVFAQAGFLLAVRPNSPTVRYYAWLFAVWFVACVALTATSVLPIANTAHGAGAAAGFLAGKALQALGYLR